MTKKFLCTQTSCLLIAALYDIGPNVEIRTDDKPGKIYVERINVTQSNDRRKEIFDDRLSFSYSIIKSLQLDV